MWEMIDSRIRQSSEAIVSAGKFDDAIFAAFRAIEGEIQIRISSGSIGQALLDEAFDGALPKILISNDTRDQSYIKSLFSGALGSIRNARGHKKEPAIPCDSLQHCFYYLGFASMLLYFLDHDKNTYPKLNSVRVFGTPDHPRAEIRGENFSGSCRVFGNGLELMVVSARPQLLEVMLPARFHGELQVVSNGKASETSYCSVEGLEKNDNYWHEVLAADLPLFSSQFAKTPIPGVVGMVLQSGQSHGFQSVVPTHPGRYKAGQIVSHGPFAAPGLDETWYRHPSSTTMELAFSGAMIANPQILGTVADHKLGGIGIAPPLVKTEIGENRALRVIAWAREGEITREIDVTDRVKWKNINPNIAFIEKGVLRPKRLGKATVECSIDGFLASAEINIESIPKGVSTTFFQGLKNLQQIRFDTDDNLYICNQSPDIFKLRRTGELETVLRLPAHRRAAAVTDCIALDKHQRLYVNHVTEGTCHRFEWDGKRYGKQKELGVTVSGTKKGIAIDQMNNVFIIVMLGFRQTAVIHVDPSGTEHHFQIGETAIHIAVDTNEKLYIPLVSKGVIGVFSYDGRKLSEIPYLVEPGHSPADIYVSDSGDIYLPIFQNGRVLKIRTDGVSKGTSLPGAFGVPGGIAFDSTERMFISDFRGNEIFVVY